MAPLNCCGFGRSPSPDAQPVRLAEVSHPKTRFALSSHSITPEEHLRDSDTIPRQSVSTTDEIHQTSSAGTSGNNLLEIQNVQEGIQRRHSSRKLHSISSKISKKVSRESDVSRRSSKQPSRKSFSAEGAERREELKRALHRRVRDSALDDSTTDDYRYDEDAVQMKTPKSTIGRHEGMIHVSPRYLSNVLRRSDSPSLSVQQGHQSRKTSGSYATNDTATALSWMLTTRASHLTAESEWQDFDKDDETPRRPSTKKKYLFEDGDTPKAAPQNRSPSMLDRSNTIRQTRRVSNPVELGPMTASHLRTFGATPPSSALSISSTPSLDKSGFDGLHRPEAMKREELPQGGKERLLSTDTDLPTTIFVADRASSEVYDTKIRSASEYMLRGPSVISKSARVNNSSSDHTTDSGYADEGSWDMSNERSVRGIDRRATSPSTSVYHTARTRIQSEGSEPTVASHIYNRHVPLRLASKSHLNAASLPQLAQTARKRSFSSQGSESFSVKPTRQESSSETMPPSAYTSSSGLHTLDIPVAWNNVGRHGGSSVYSTQQSSSGHATGSLQITNEVPGEYPSSSVYSSKPESQISSREGSVHRMISVHDKMKHMAGHFPSDNEIISPRPRGKSVDLERLEQHTKDASYHSINDSLRHQEIASAESRIVSLPRANTLPKYSRFKEDLEEVSAQLERSKPPPRRRVSNLDGSGDSLGDRALRPATSMWEKALREHSMEDAALAHTRLGSDMGGPLDVTSYKSHTRSRLSSEIEGPLDAPPPTQRSHTRLGSGIGGPLDVSTHKESVELTKQPSRPPLIQTRKHITEHLASYTLSSPSKIPTIKKEKPFNQPIEAPAQRRASTTSTTSAWSRFPSHSRLDRSLSPAGPPDQIIVRDFASMDNPPAIPGSYVHQQLHGRLKNHERSESLGKNMWMSVKRIYRTNSQELVRRLGNEAKGHRSSISEGGVVEYPELEMLGRVGTPEPSPDIDVKKETEDMVRRKASFSVEGSEGVEGLDVGGDGVGMGREVGRRTSGMWARSYEDCLEGFPSMLSSLPQAKIREGRRWVVSGDGAGSGSGSGVVSGSGSGSRVGSEKMGQKSPSSEMRASTLDFKRSLDLAEERERERLRELLGGGMIKGEDGS